MLPSQKEREMNQRRAKEVIKCAGAHIEYPPANANGYQHVDLGCQKCSDLSFCLKVKNLVEYAINGGK